MTRRTGLLLALLLAATALLPLALADHAYSHRYVVFGRVVDAEGNPVPGVVVDLGTRNFQPEGNCAQQPLTETDAFGRTETRFQTNELGEFMFCYHAHELNRIEPPIGILAVQQFNYTHEFRFDPYIRTTFHVVKLESVEPTAIKGAYERNYTVLGRLWTDAHDRILVDNIPVFGHTVDRTPVNITIDLPNGTKLTHQTATNNYGDFAVRIPTEARLTGGTVTIEAQGRTFSAPVDPVGGATAVYGTWDEEGGSASRTALIVLGAIVGVAVVGGAGWYGIRRVAERREEEAVRRGSTRKRANR